jgi:tetratricopeptide (TPR) repeat protein
MRPRHLTVLLFCALLLCPTIRGQEEALVHEEQVRLANGLYSRGMYALALEEYQRLIEMETPPADLDVLFYRAAESARALGETRQAVQFYLRVVGMNREGETLNRARLRLADLLYREKKVGPALGHVEALLASKPAAEFAASAGYLRGQLLEASGKSNAAAEAYRGVIRDFPEDPMAAYAALQLANTLKEVGVRKAYYQKVLELATTPDMEVEALWGLAQLEREQGNMDAAAKRMWQLRLQHPDSARLRQGMLQVAWTQLQAGNYKEALEVSAEVPAESKKAYGDTWLYLDAVSYGQTEQPGKSVAAYEALLKAYPETRFRSAASYELAVQYAKAGRHADVLRLQEDVLKLGEREADAWWLLAESARAGGKAELALSYYDRIAALPATKSRYHADAVYLRAVMRDELNDEQRSEAYVQFAKAYPKDARAAGALHRAGALWLASGKTDAAFGAWDLAVTTYPDHPSNGALLFQLAMMDLRAGRDDAALKRLQGVLNREQDAALHPESRYWVGILLDRKGNLAEAGNQWAKALEGNLKPELVAKTRSRLGYNLQKREQPAEALAVLSPLLTAAPDQVPDSLLMWMFRVSEEGVGEVPTLGMAQVMRAEGRSKVLRELGAYAVAREMRDAGKREEAIRAWKEGLAFESGSVEAVKAGLAMGRVQMEAGTLAEAKTAFTAASRLASGLEAAALQVEAMMALGDVEMAMKSYDEAARLYMGIAVLYEDPQASPLGLWKAAEAFTLAGKPDRAAKATQELSKRYPDFVPPPKNGTPN